MTDPRRALLSLALAALGTFSQEVRAESIPVRHPHRVSVTGRYGVGIFGADDDGHWADSGTAAGVGAGYAYDLGHVELGAGFDFTVLSADRWKVYAPWASVRPHVAFGDLDLGVTLRIGPAWQVLPDIPDDTNYRVRHDHVFSGPMLALDVGARLWGDPRFAVEFGPEVVAAQGGDDGDARGYYLRDTAGLLSLGGFVRGVFAP